MFDVGHALPRARGGGSRNPYMAAGPFVAPPGLPLLPLLPVAMTAPGQVTTDRNAVEAAYAWADNASRLVGVSPSGLVTDARYVAPPSHPTRPGNDANPGTYAAPFATLAKALRNNALALAGGATHPSRIYLLEGAYAPSAPRWTDPLQGQVPGGMLFHVSPAPFVDPQAVRVTHPGDDIAAAGWTDGGGGVWSRVLATANTPHRLVWEALPDAQGEPTSLRRWASLAELQAAASGWFWDGVPKSLALKLPGGPSVEANRGGLRALYLAGDATTNQVGARCLWEDIHLDGVRHGLLSGAGSPQTELWLQGGRVRWANGNGIDATKGPLVCAHGTRLHASSADNVNLFDPDTNNGGRQGLACLANLRLTAAGDVAAAGTGVTQNRNALSLHGGADGASFGLACRSSFGPDIADTALAGLTNRSWHVGAVVSDSSQPGQAFQFSGNGSGTRLAWLDGCAAGPGVALRDLEALQTGGGGVAVRLHACSLPRRLITGTATVADYARASP